MCFKKCMTHVLVGAGIFHLEHLMHTQFQVRGENLWKGCITRNLVLPLWVYLTFSVTWFYECHIGILFSCIQILYFATFIFENWLHYSWTQNGNAVSTLLVTYNSQTSAYLRVHPAHSWKILETQLFIMQFFSYVKNGLPFHSLYCIYKNKWQFWSPKKNNLEFLNNHM